MTTKDMDLDCYWINLETADNEAFKRVITDELKYKIDTLQRYHLRPYLWIEESDEWFFVRYDHLKKLLED